MNSRALKKDNKGFTIIEVMIVLAIAGLIILIVFLAVPALQRNSRNNQRRNDAARISGLVAEAVTNNNGLPPANAAALAVPVSSMSYYSAVDNNVAAGVETIGYRLGEKCAANVLSPGGPRSYAVSFRVETSAGGNGIPQCV